MAYALRNLKMVVLRWLASRNSLNHGNLFGWRISLKKIAIWYAIIFLFSLVLDLAIKKIALCGKEYIKKKNKT